MFSHFFSPQWHAHSQKVKADKNSPNLARLQQASKGVTQATAGVVASTKSGKSQIEETGECVHLFTLVVSGAKWLHPPYCIVLCVFCFFYFFIPQLISMITQAVINVIAQSHYCSSSDHFFFFCSFRTIDPKPTSALISVLSFKQKSLESQSLPSLKLHCIAQADSPNTLTHTHPSSFFPFFSFKGICRYYDFMI